jgi:hypothetical protein
VEGGKRKKRKAKKVKSRKRPARRSPQGEGGKAEKRLQDEAATSNQQPATIP